MDTGKPSLVEPETSRIVLDAFFAVYRSLGYGFLEAVYENAMIVALREAGLRPVQQAPLKVRFRGQVVGDYRADILIPGVLLLEIKSASSLVPAHDAQLINYLKATGLRVGMLLNFGPRPTFRRKAN